MLICLVLEMKLIEVIYEYHGQVKSPYYSVHDAIQSMQQGKWTSPFGRLIIEHI